MCLHVCIMFIKTNLEMARNLPKVISRINSEVHLPEFQNLVFFLLKRSLTVIQNARAGLREVFKMLKVGTRGHTLDPSHML